MTPLNTDPGDWEYLRELFNQVQGIGPHVCGTEIIERGRRSRICIERKGRSSWLVRQRLQKIEAHEAADMVAQQAHTYVGADIPVHSTMYIRTYMSKAMSESVGEEVLLSSSKEDGM